VSASVKVVNEEVLAKLEEDFQPGVPCSGARKCSR
jgi:hypothetical protein